MKAKGIHPGSPALPDRTWSPTMPAWMPVRVPCCSVPCGCGGCIVFFVEAQFLKKNWIAHHPIVSKSVIVKCVVPFTLPTWFHLVVVRLCHNDIGQWFYPCFTGQWKATQFQSQSTPVCSSSTGSAIYFKFLNLVLSFYTLVFIESCQGYCLKRGTLICDSPPKTPQIPPAAALRVSSGRDVWPCSMCHWHVISHAGLVRIRER